MTTNNNNNLQLKWDCLMIERMVSDLVLKGIHKNEDLVAAVDEFYPPTTEFEMEHYSEAIIYAKLSLLN